MLNRNNKDLPFVSIIMNCYNSSTFLKEAIISVINQTYINFELIFWDNISTDSSAEIFKSFSDNRLKYYLSDIHTTLGEARNLAVKKVNYEWMCFLDCDDIWLPEKLEKQISIIINNKDDFKLGLIYGPTNIILNDNRRVRHITKENFPEGDIFNELLKENFIPLLTALMRTKYFHECGGIDNNLKQAEDYDLFLKITKISKSKIINEPLTLYRQHGQNISIKQSELNFTEALQIISKYMPNKEVEKSLKIWNSKYAIYKFANKEFISGFFILFFNGSLPFFINFLITILKTKKISNENFTK